MIIPEEKSDPSANLEAPSALSKSSWRDWTSTGITRILKVLAHLLCLLIFLYLHIELQLEVDSSTSLMLQYAR
jgi:hypothetical protein